MGYKENADSEKSVLILANMAVENWKFAQVFARAIRRLDASEQSRYVSQMNWFIKQTEENLNAVNLRIVNLVGQEFTAGMAATAINIGHFDEEESLIVDTMLEPVVMGNNGVIKMGVVVLRGK